MSATFMIPNDLSDLCRVCLQLPEESQYLDLNTICDENGNLTYSECFTICTQIDLSAGEGVPHHLCKACGFELQMSYDFHKKIEQSKRVIEHCQRQIKENEHSTKLSTQVEDESDMVQMLSNKYEINDYDMQLPGTSPKMHHVSEPQYETTFEAEDDKTDELDVLSKLCQSDIHNTNEDINSGVTAPITEADTEEHLDGEDYQNLEALEEEETETIQIKVDDTTIPMQITKYKIVKSDTSEEYLEHTTEDNVEDVEIEVGQIEEVAEMEKVGEIDELYNAESFEEEFQEHLRWQDNVVAVANKEHLPIEIDDDNAEIIDENQTLIEEHSLDEIIEEEEEEEEEANIKDIKNTNENTMRKRHVGSYSCDFCHRVFPNYSRMKTHRRCHEIDRPKFSCTQCSRVYSTKQARDCHVQTAHEKFGYTCSICNKVFAIYKSLEIHERYHTRDFPYECVLCDRKFAQACHLNTHINVKHNKIRFSCDYSGCGKYFTSSTSLRNHEFTHSAMPFECKYCQRGYPAKAKLRIHIQRKHGFNLNKDELENMRKFHVTRSKVNLVQFVE